MIDIKLLRQDPEAFRQSATQRRMDSRHIDGALAADAKRVELTGQVDDLRSQLNVKGKPTATELTMLQDIKVKLGLLEQQLGEVQADYDDHALQIPNLLAPETPEGDEADNAEVRHWGKHPKFDFEAKDHVEIAESHGWLDFERGAKVAGSKFYYTLGPLVRLENAVTNLIYDLVAKEGLVPVQVPHMVSTRVASGAGFLPRGEERQIYKIEGEDLNLIATAEIPLTGFYADEIVPPDKLPTTFIGFSPSYRLEAGAYGKYSKGLYRVHQFNKLEMYVFCRPEESAEWHKKLVRIEEDICQALELPYRVVRIAAGDLGAPAYEKYDVEYWSPLENTYRELMSCSNVTDFQSRRLNIRYRDANDKTQFVHTLNGTAAAFSRLPIALIENHQQADGTIKLPKALVTYYGKDTL